MSGTTTESQNNQQDQGPMASSAPQELPAHHPEPLLVLIAEDEAPIAEAISILVQENGYSPLMALNGRQALELARQQHPALVITDLMMPYLDGDDLIRLLRDDAAATNQMPPHTILISAAGWRRMLNAGADAVLSKPFDLDDLERLIQRFLS